MAEHSRIGVAIEALLQAGEFYKAENYICAVILAGASQQVLRDLCVANGVEPTVKTVARLSDKSTNMVHNMIVAAYNKTKHADVDPKDPVFISKDEARMLITIATTDLMRLQPIENQKIMDFLNFVRNIRD